MGELFKVYLLVTLTNYLLYLLTESYGISLSHYFFIHNSLNKFNLTLCRFGRGQFSSTFNLLTQETEISLWEYLRYNHYNKIKVLIVIILLD